MRAQRAPKQEMITYDPLVGVGHHQAEPKTPPKRCATVEEMYAVARPYFEGTGNLARVEELWVFAFNSHMNLTGDAHMVSRGDPSATDVPLPSILRHVLNCPLATSFAIVHNHPTGNVTASAADLAVTRKIRTGGKAIDIQLVDHLVIAPDSWYSIRRQHPEIWYA